MTDQEKAEEYVKEQILRPKSAATYIDELSQAYLAGLAEGRKETEEKLFNEWGKGETPESQKCPFLQKLERENIELKQSKNALTIQYEQDISELRQQNEQMRCCGNCEDCKGLLMKLA